MGFVSVSDQAKIFPFYFTAEPADVIVARDQPLLLNCSTSGRPEAAATIQWKRDGIPINLNGDTRRSLLPNGSLSFTKVLHSRGEDRPDEGVYQCSATSSSLGTIVSRPAKLQIASLPPFEDEPQDQRRIEGQTARMACYVPGRPQPTVTWFKEDRLLLRDGRMLVLPSGALEIESVRSADAGSYKCKVQNAEGERFSAVGRLMVDGDPDPDAELQAPIFSTRSKTLTLQRGTTTTIECSAYGFPTPTITWLKNGVSIDLKASRFSVVGSGNLHIESVQPDDAGQYKCRAENSADTVDIISTLEVHESPVLVKKPVDTYGRKDSDVLLECEIRGTPEPTIQWMKNGDVVIPSDYFQIDNGKNLRILGLVQSDAGVYQCFGTNAAGSVQGTAQLIVLDAGAASPPTNTPSAPRDLTASLISSRFVTLTWLAPLVTNSGAVLTYSVYYKQVGSTRERVFNTSTTQKEANIQGLRPDSNYAFRVVAYNDFGPGDSTKELTVRTHPEVDVPGPVSNFRVFPLSTTEVKVEWDPPQYASGSIKNYKISYREPGSVASTDVNTEKRQYVLGSLRPFVEYIVTVVAFNENGPGIGTAEVSVKTYSDVPTGAPENVLIEPTSANSLTVRWDPPAVSLQNGAITGYKIRYRNKGTKKTDVATVDGVRRAFTIINLERGQPYLLRIAATNINGTGPPTDWLSGETFSDDLDELRVPGQPSALRVRPTAKSIVVNWSPPTDGNIVVRGYTIGWGIGIPDVYSKIVDSKDRIFSIDELEPGSEYVISLRAFNNMGDGRPTYETVTTRLPSAPAETQTVVLPPVGLQAIVISDTTVLVRWTDSSLAQGALPNDNRLYTVRYSRVNAETQRPKTVESSDLEVPVDGLRANTPYMFEVKVSKGRVQSTWSLSVVNRTFEAAPSSYPQDLTIMPVHNNPTAVIVNYAPPEQSNGLITGYLVFFTSDNSLNDLEWSVEGVVGDKLTTVIRNLTPNTKYFFKIQARNSKGYSPHSTVVSYTTPVGDPSRSYSEDGDGLSTNTLYIIIACVACACLILFTVVIIVYCCRRKYRNLAASRKGNSGYHAAKGNKKGKHPFGNGDLKPPDLWLHHNDNLELKHTGEKSPHEIVPILKHSNEYTNNINLSATLDRLQKRTNSFVDIKNNIDGRTYNDMSKFNSLSRRAQRPMMISLDQQQQQQYSARDVPVANNNGGINTRPPDTVMQHNVFPRHHHHPHQMQRLPTIQSSPPQQQSLMASPDPSSPSTTAGYDTASSGAQIISGSDTLRSVGHQHRSPHPLKSFSVPAPPPQAAPPHVVGVVVPPSAGGSGLTPRQPALKQPSLPNQANGHALTSQPGGSPYKRSPMTVSIQSQPHQSRSPKPPVTFSTTLPTKEDGRPSRTYNSDQELSAEMATLDGLMDDLNAITRASEFNC
ncbi:Neogenin [Hypsibius exemplaris]|uniref:Neogenin n=1 Tax=Hypsibius exemplaris TaxID=2072580 RepID=A0A1W0XBU0_HYPEX|nr:Neogenin [Hypsibius exemplaris]